MEIQAIYENGVLKPTRPLNLKRRLVTIYVPDEEISGLETSGEKQDLVKKYNLPPEVEAMAEEMRARLAAVHEEVMNIPEDQLPPLTEKQQERIKAFEMREDR